MGFNRAERKNTVLTREQQKNRPIEEKESNRWLETMENADRDIGDAIKILHICDREGDNYEGKFALVGWEGQNELLVMGRRESKPFGPDFKNCIRSWTTVNYSILWVKFSS
jgi:hypothetical protein